MAPASETYTKRLLTKGHGYPLWRPDLDENLPEENKTEGIRIGDLGLIMDGEFSYLFNICAPAEHDINCGRTPSEFQHLDLGFEAGGIRIGKKYIEHRPRGHRKPCTIESIHDSTLQIFGDAMGGFPYETTCC